MKHFAILFSGLLLGTVLLPLPAAQAADCSSAAQRVADRTGGEILNVVASSDGSSCDITVRVPGKNGKPPRVVTRTVKR
jgi:hypothetical protein